MPESFDQKISRKIRSVFEQYDEPFNESAWDLMKQKLARQKKKKRIFLLFDLAKAASVILFIGLTVLLPYEIKNWHASGNKPVNHNEGDFLFAKKHDFTGTGYDLQDNSLNNTNYTVIKNKINDNNIKIADNKKVMIEYSNFKPNDSVQNNNENNFIYAENNFNEIIMDTSSVINEKDTGGKYDNRPVLGPNDSDFFIKKKSEKKLNFGIALSSHYSSSDIGATDNINIGGGFLTEYMINKTVSVSSGVYVSNHNLSTNNSFASGFSKTDNFSEVNVVNSTDEIEKNAEKDIALIGLDIPLNININFNKIFVSAGISSLVYLKEKYSESYLLENTHDVYNMNTSEYETVYMYENVNNTMNKGAFRTFDFAKLLNLSIGYKIPLKRGKLILEPFAKLPVGSLTSYNIAYGYGGFALKYDF